jgi:chromate transporter
VRLWGTGVGRNAGTAVWVGRVTAEKPTVARVFWAFFRAGIAGFGGVLPMARHELVVRQGWLTAAEFSDLFALCQFLPGANVANLSVIYGARVGGVAGAVAGIVGLTAAPVAVVLGLAVLYGRYGALPPVRHLVAGLSDGAAGLILATALRIAWPLRASARGVVVAAAVCLAVGVLRLPFLACVAVFAPVSVALAWRGAA